MNAPVKLVDQTRRDQRQRTYREERRVVLFVMGSGRRSTAAHLTIRLTWTYESSSVRQRNPDGCLHSHRLRNFPYRATPGNGVPATRQSPTPTPSAVQTAMQRALVKAIALHGLGLYIYAGEDLPAADPDQREVKLQELRDASLKGVDALRVAWTALPKELQISLAA